jgi:hypothetical protein
MEVGMNRFQDHGISVVLRSRMSHATAMPYEAYSQESQVDVDNCSSRKENSNYRRAEACCLTQRGIHDGKPVRFERL